MTRESLNNLWKSALKIVEKQLSVPEFKAWIEPIIPVALVDRKLTVAVPTEFSKEKLEAKYLETIFQALQGVIAQMGNREALSNIEVVVDGKLFPETSDKRTTTVTGSNQDFEKPNLNPRYTFESFVVGNGNKFAHAAAFAVAEGPARSYNPLFIYGGVGLGKTHLMHAIGHHIIRNNPELRVVYASSEKFTNELINAIRDDKTEEFRQKYRSVDVLLIDDIQFLAGKERTQEEFFHTFNALYEAFKQIVLTSDRPPKEIPTLEDRLRSRFEWGLIADIQPPDLETRIAILRKKAELEMIEVPDEVIYFIADKIPSNIRELEGALVRIKAFCTLNQISPTVEIAQEILKDIIPRKHPKKISVAAIQKVVAEHFNIKPSAMKMKKRTKELAYPRQIAMYLARELTDLSLPSIGSEFGGRDHTTVLHAFEKIKSDMERNPQLAQEISGLIEKIKSLAE
ncbi:chromosomal replication initiator protein DnaA [Thermatribacter velox]|jgi:chromosomal replication initiator protein|uniref:Chromosomal replication initiator protein DnaA n=1 Tax=Thermatribacter velox TaxID=3039681 RepID=A0ABZ2YEA1_9BACT|nr:chromosomal replication initiator protein [Candidatus Atribacteria bacterium]